MKKEEVESLLKSARESFLAKDRDLNLLEINVNERALTHKFAEHIQAHLGDTWNVDCEYNRDGTNPKRIDRIIEIVGAETTTYDTKSITVYPDIIIHKRGPAGPNAVIIEAKKNNNEGNDIEKIKAIKDEYDYAHGVFLKFDTKGKNISWEFVS